MSGALLTTIALPAAAQSGTATDETTGRQASAPADDPRLVEARLHFANGVELLQSTPSNYQDALPQFLAAYEKSGQSWKVLGNLGLCALKLERDGEALAYYRRYLDEGGDEVDPAERSEIERELLLVEGNMAEVVISAPAAAVQIKVERQGSNAPPQVYRIAEGSTTLGLRAGALTLTARADGKTEIWEVVVTPGQKVGHALSFAAPAEQGTALAPTAPPPATTGSSGMSTLRLTGFVTAGAGAAALIGGAVTGLLSKQRERDALDQCEGRACAPSARADFDSAKSFATVTNVLLIGGGVLAATGVTLVVLGGSKTSERPNAARLVLTPTALPQGGGLSASGTF